MTWSFNPLTFDMKIIPAFPSTSVDHLTAVFLRIEHTEDTLAHWLQTHRPKIVSVHTHFHIFFAHDFTYSFQNPFLSRLLCCLDWLTPMISSLSLKWSSGKLRCRCLSRKRKIAWDSLSKEGVVLWRRWCIACRWKYHYSVKLSQTCVKSLTLENRKVSHVIERLMSSPKCIPSIGASSPKFGSTFSEHYRAHEGMPSSSLAQFQSLLASKWHASSILQEMPGMAS